MPDATRYRVDFQQGSDTSTIGHLADCYAHHSALDPFVSRLLRDGKVGIVSLVDDATGERLARRRVTPLAQSSRQRTRQRGVSPLLLGIPGDAESDAAPVD